MDIYKKQKLPIFYIQKKKKKYIYIFFFFFKIPFLLKSNKTITIPSEHFKKAAKIACGLCTKQNILKKIKFFTFFFFFFYQELVKNINSKIKSGNIKKRAAKISYDLNIK